MDLNSIWRSLEKEQFNSSNLNKDIIMKAISKESQSPLNELRKRLSHKMYWILGFSIVILVLMFIFHENTSMVIVFSILETWYLVGLLYSFIKVKNLKQIHLKTDMGENIKKVVQVFHKNTKQVLQFEEWMGTLFIPIAVICGLLLPLFYRGMQLQEILENSKILIVAVISLIVMVPLAIWAAKSMNKHAFQEYLEQLEYYKRRLDEL